MENQEPKTESEGGTPVALGTSLTIADVADLHPRLAGVLESETVSLNGVELKRIDACGVQLLHSFTQTRASQGKQTRWSAASEELRNAYRDLGVDGEWPMDNEEARS
ncbi:MAG: STAS domain-containing protein [Myxococcota bacterium]